MKLLFIRHAQSENNLLYDQTGSSKGRNEDPELSVIGHKQAKKLGRFLKAASSGRRLQNNTIDGVYDFSITHLYTSLMARAVITGEYIAKELNKPLLGHMDIFEGGGIYCDDENGNKLGRPGKPRSYFQNNHPLLIIPDEFGEQGWWNRPYEDEAERVLRARKVLNFLIENHGNSTDYVAFISHGEFFNVFISVLLGIGWPNRYWFLMNNCGLTRLDLDAEEVRFVYLNRNDHIPRKMLT